MPPKQSDKINLESLKNMGAALPAIREERDDQDAIMALDASLKEKKPAEEVDDEAVEATNKEAGEAEAPLDEAIHLAE